MNGFVLPDDTSLSYEASSAVEFKNNLNLD